MKKNKAMIKKKKRDKLKKELRKKELVKKSKFGPIQISCSDENGDEVILLDRTEEWKKYELLKMTNKQLMTN
jgi:hypothetical protein